MGKKRKFLPVEVYAIECHLVDDEWNCRFTFNALDEADAIHLAKGWALYHHIIYGEDVRVRKATDDEKAADYLRHNEYV